MSTVIAPVVSSKVSYAGTGSIITSLTVFSLYFKAQFVGSEVEQYPPVCTDSKLLDKGTRCYESSGAFRFWVIALLQSTGLGPVNILK